MEVNVKKIDINNLEEILKENQNEKVTIELKGMVTAQFAIQSVRTIFTKDFISFFDDSAIEKSSKVLSINKHQIMKITEQRENVLIIEFDAPQSVKIFMLRLEIK